MVAVEFAVVIGGFSSVVATSGNTWDSVFGFKLFTLVHQGYRIVFETNANLMERTFELNAREFPFTLSSYLDFILDPSSKSQIFIQTIIEAINYTILLINFVFKVEALLNGILDFLYAMIAINSSSREG